MRIVKISGGLGNQMFQYAFSLALKAAGNTDVKLDLSTYRAKSDYNGIDLVHNGFELTELFDVQYKEASPKDVAHISYQPTNLLNRVLRKDFTKKTHFIDKKFSFQPELLTMNSENIYFEGYWQTEKYFLNIENKIRETFSFKKKLSPRSQELLNSLSDNSTSIHIRRGDYLKTQTMNVCGKNYYLNAIEKLSEQTKINEILVFSDDLDWCRTELNLETFACKVIYVDWNVKSDSWQDMVLMSKCKNHIIANSSFSWWGAWLDPRKDKIVICPEIWDLKQLNSYLDKYYRSNYDDIIPNVWQKCPINYITKADSTPINKTNFEYTPEKAAELFPDERLKDGTDLQKAQRVMLRILKVFDAICRKHNLTYWLDGGTMLGAARHKGFIPWDDDVDVDMPIDDYEKFCAIAEKELPFDMFFQTHETDPKHDITWAKIRDRFSYMDDPGGPYPYCQGIPIDIFPLYKKTYKEYKNRHIIGLLPPFNNKPMKISPRYSPKHNLHNFIWGVIQYFYLLIFNSSFIRNRYLARVSKSDGNTKIGWIYRPGSPWFQFYPDDCVFPLSKIQFEDTFLSAPNDVDKYLTLLYGDWRTPPPESKRDVHGTTGIHLTDAGPVPYKHSLKWEDYH